MTSTELFTELKEVVRMSGFKAKEDNWFVIFIEDTTGTVCFHTKVERDYAKAMETNKVKGELSFSASISRAGGEPTADELKESGELIIRAANLVNRLNRLHPKFIDVIGKEN